MTRFTVLVDGVYYAKNADGTIMSGDLIDTLAAYENAEDEGRLIIFESVEKRKRVQKLTGAYEAGLLEVKPCKVGDTINAFRFDAEKGLYVISDKVTAVSFNRRGYTVRTKSKFYPIREADGYTFAPISEYPTALADFYIGSAEEAAAALGKEQEG